MLGLLAWAFKGLVYVAIITKILTCTCLLMSRKQFPWSPPRPFYAILKFPKPSGVVVGDNDIMPHLGLSVHSLLSLQVGRSGSPLISIFHKKEVPWCGLKDALTFEYSKAFLRVVYLRFFLKALTVGCLPLLCLPNPPSFNLSCSVSLFLVTLFKNSSLVPLFSDRHRGYTICPSLQRSIPPPWPLPVS